MQSYHYINLFTCCAAELPHFDLNTLFYYQYSLQLFSAEAEQPYPTVQALERSTSDIHFAPPVFRAFKHIHSATQG